MASSFVAELNINLLPAITLVLIWLDIREDEAHDPASRLFLVLVWLLIGMLVLEPFTWLFDGASPRYAPFLYLSNILFLMMGVFSIYLWFAYVCHKTNPRLVVACGRLPRLLIILPALLVSVLIVVLPGQSGVFYIDDANRYQRGALYLLPYAVSVLYLLMCGVVSIYTLARGASGETRRLARCLSFTLIPPVLALTVQSRFYGWWIARPMFALVVLYLYLNIQRQAVSSDSLTGLNNRKQMSRYLQRKLHSNEPAARWCLIMIDIDHFKRINDNHGHAVGDAIIAAFGAHVRLIGPAEMIAGRIGGEEFALLVPGAGIEAARQLAETVRTGLQAACADRIPAKLCPTASLGIAIGAPGTGLSALMADADQALYEAKRTGRNRVRTFTPKPVRLAAG